MKTMNIMTSCDDGLALYIMPQLASISINMPDTLINFYLFHHSVSAESVRRISEYAATLRNIKFKEIAIEKEDAQACEKLMDVGNNFPGEAYYYLLAPKYIPNCDRVLYIDSGDVIIVGDISDYYYADFDGNIVVTHATQYLNEYRGFEDRSPYFTIDDYENKTIMRPIKSGLFSSGCFVLNNALLSEIGVSMKDYLGIAGTVYSLGGEFHGDQALASAAFVGCIKFYVPPGVPMDSSYRPFNFFLDGAISNIAFDQGVVEVTTKRGTRFKPLVYHYGGECKPWHIRPTDEDYAYFKKYLPPITEMLHINGCPTYAYEGLRWFFEAFWYFCEMTPIYEKCVENMKISGRIFKGAYFTTFIRLFREAQNAKRPPMERQNEEA